MRTQEMNTDQQIEQVELTIGEAKKNIEKREALLRLTKNKDFNKIIDTGYFMDEATRLVWLKAEPASKDIENDIIRQIDAIGSLRQYLRTILTIGEMSERAVMDNEETLQDLLNEQQQAS